MESAKPLDRDDLTRADRFGKQRDRIAGLLDAVNKKPQFRPTGRACVRLRMEPAVHRVAVFGGGGGLEEIAERARCVDQRVADDVGKGKGRRTLIVNRIPVRDDAGVVVGMKKNMPAEMSAGWLVILISLRCFLCYL